MLTQDIPIQHTNPIRMGFPPVLTSFIIFVLKPMADIAITIKNLDTVLNGENTSGFIPAAEAIVVISDAPIKKRIKNGKTLLNLKPLVEVPFSERARRKASTSVIGIIASVRVSLTIVAESKALAPGCIPSHAVAAAVTEEVSFIAVPAKIPKPSFDKPSIVPRVGNIRAAITLNKNMTEIDCAISSSSASMTEDAAAMADPPHIHEPIPTS